MSMLRNVLTYMGLGPDEDYDDGYLYETGDDDIDLTDRGSIAGPRATAARSRTSRRSADLDPHAQRERPDWLDDQTATAPAPTPTFDFDQGRDQPAVPYRSAVEGPAVEDTAFKDTAFKDAAFKDAAFKNTAVDDTALVGTALDDTAAANGRDATPSVRPLRAVPPAEFDDPSPSVDGITVRSVDGTDSASASSSVSNRSRSRTGGSSHVSSPGVKPKALSPQSFGDAKELADEFKADVPVIMNLQEIDRQLARRLIDFASGICYAMDGSMEKIAPQVFLLTPEAVEVSDEDRRRIEARRYDR